MQKVEIVKAKNGWVVWPESRQAHLDQEPLIFTNWNKLTYYLRRQLAPEMKDVE